MTKIHCSYSKKAYYLLASFVRISSHREVILPIKQCVRHTLTIIIEEESEWKQLQLDHYSR